LLEYAFPTLPHFCHQWPVEDGFNLTSVNGGLKLGCFGRFERQIFFVLFPFVFFCVERFDSLF